MGEDHRVLAAGVAVTIISLLCTMWMQWRSARTQHTLGALLSLRSDKEYLIAARKVVHIHYTLKNDAGELLDKSPADEPLGYLHGAGNIIPGLEAALSGMKAGEEVQVDFGTGPTVFLQ